MTYQPDQPAANTSPQSSVSFIKDNFAQYAGIFSRLTGGITYNHVAMNDNDQGLHSAVIFQNQTTDPDVEDNINVLYSHDATSAVSTEPQLFQRSQETQGILPDFPIQLTYNKVNVAGPQYQSFMMGGYLLYVGSTSNIAVPITLSPVPSEIVNVQINVQNVDGSSVPYDGGVTVTQPATIKINSSNAPGGTTYLWMAVGKA